MYLCKFGVNTTSYNAEQACNCDKDANNKNLVAFNH